jgi:hypothetical protein
MHSSRTKLLTDSILADITAGLSLRKSAATHGVPPSTFISWCNEDAALAEQYARARENGIEVMADDILEISDEASVEARYQGEDVTLALDATAVARNRLRVDTRKWLLSKMAPKKFGDKLDLNHSGGVTFERIEAVVVDPKG